MVKYFKPTNIDYEKELGDAGHAPFTRGANDNMYCGKPFTMRQLSGFGSPEDTNKRMKFLLDNGATGLSVLFDFPTIQMYDSDDPISVGHVGLSGVCVDSVEDMKALFADIDLDKISISIVTHYPTNTAILLSMFLTMAEERGYSIAQLRGSVQNDMTMEEVVRCGAEFISPKDCFRIQCDNIEFIRMNMPLWNPVTLNGYNLREAGTSDITEMAIAIANAISILDEMKERGYSAEFIAKRIAFFWSIGNDFFREVCRLRAIRRVWYNILHNDYDIESPSGLRCHVQTSGISLTHQEPFNNIVRASYQALAAIFGGAQSLHVDSYDEAYSVPSEEAALISLRTQQIIQEEIGVTDYVDPLGGSYCVEQLTNQIEQEIAQELLSIIDKGGYIALVESGELYRQINLYGYQQQIDIEQGKTIVVGVNKYAVDDNVVSFTPFTYPKGVEEKQKARLAELRQNRNQCDVVSALKSLQDACKEQANIFPYCLACAKARCTEGEMFDAIKTAFGTWQKIK